MEESKPLNRRQWLSSLLAGAGLLLSYGLFGIQGALFLMPERTGIKKRKLFAGNIDQYEPGKVKQFYDLQGKLILVKRDRAGFKAFSSRCPHLGCNVHWEEENDRFFCPCHNGVFNPDGKAIAGPPGDAGQKLDEVAVSVDERSGVVYIEVDDIGTGGNT